MQEGLSKKSSKASLKAAELSSDSDVEAYVSMGVHNAYSVAEKTVRDNFHPYAVSFLLSLSTEQLNTLQEKQLALTQDSDPLYLSNQVLESLDEVQEKLLKDSKLWLLPRRQIIKKKPRDLLVDQKMGERDPKKGLYSFYSIKLSNLILPKPPSRETLSEQRKKDQTIFKFSQKAPEFIKSLPPS